MSSHLSAEISDCKQSRSNCSLKGFFLTEQGLPHVESKNWQHPHLFPCLEDSYTKSTYKNGSLRLDLKGNDNGF